MDDTFLTVVKNKYIEILLVGLVLWLAVFLINKALQLFFKRTEFIEDKKKKQLRAWSNQFRNTPLRFALYYMSFLSSFMISEKFLQVLVWLGSSSVLALRRSFAIF